MKPVRVCFYGGPAPTGHERRTDCMAVERDSYPFQTLVSARVETLSRASGRPAVIVTARFSGGAHTLTRTSVWSFTGFGFLDAFDTDLGDLGDEERYVSGPLDGYCVTADHVLTRPGETYWDPHRYSVRVYRLDASYGGYLQVLQYVTARVYPSERETPHVVVDGERPAIRRLLGEVYPAGPPP